MAIFSVEVEVELAKDILLFKEPKSWTDKLEEKIVSWISKWHGAKLNNTAGLRCYIKKTYDIEATNPYEAETLAEELARKEFESYKKNSKDGFSDFEIEGLWACYIINDSNRTNKTRISIS